MHNESILHFTNQDIFLSVFKKIISSEKKEKKEERKRDFLFILLIKKGGFLDLIIGFNTYCLSYPTSFLIFNLHSHTYSAWADSANERGYQKTAAQERTLRPLFNNQIKKMHPEIDKDYCEHKREMARKGTKIK